MLLVGQDGHILEVRFEPNDTLAEVSAYMHLTVDELIRLLNEIKEDTDKAKVICTRDYRCEVVSE